jgi:heme-degrading monooxygenase HmoA
MKSPKNKEYTPPTAARCKEDSERIKQEVEAFLAKGGAINTIPGNIEITDAHKKTQVKRDAARKRGMKNMTVS